MKCPEVLHKKMNKCSLISSFEEHFLQYVSYFAFHKLLNIINRWVGYFFTSIHTPNKYIVICRRETFSKLNISQLCLSLYLIEASFFARINPRLLITWTLIKKVMMILLEVKICTTSKNCPISFAWYELTWPTLCKIIYFIKLDDVGLIHVLLVQHCNSIG